MQDSSKSQFNPPANEQQIQDLLRENSSLPTVLIQFWRQSDGAFIGDHIVLYSTQDIVERNQTHEISEYAPTLLLIGDDSGGVGFLMENRPDATAVYRQGLGAIGSEEPQQLSPNLNDWLSGNEQVVEDSELDRASFVTIYLDKPPKGGIKGLLAIKQKLQLTISVADLKSASEETPFLLVKGVYLSKYKKAIDELNAEYECIRVE